MVTMVKDDSVRDMVHLATVWSECGDNRREDFVTVCGGRW